MKAMQCVCITVNRQTKPAQRNSDTEHTILLYNKNTMHYKITYNTVCNRLAEQFLATVELITKLNNKVKHSINKLYSTWKIKSQPIKVNACTRTHKSTISLANMESLFNSHNVCLFGEFSAEQQ